MMRIAIFVGIVAACIYGVPLLLRKKFIVHEQGAVLVTGASTGIGQTESASHHH